MNERFLTEALILVLDTETTGIDPLEDRVCELGACYFKGGALVTPPLNVRINPGVPIPEGASGVHGIFDADVAEAPNFAEIAGRLEAHLSGAWAREHLGASEAPILCGYNAQHYDGPLLNAELKRAGSAIRLALSEIIDPIWCAREWGRAKKGRLSAVCEAFGIELVNAHAAWADAEATGRLLHELVLGFWISDPLSLALEDQARARARYEDQWARWKYDLYLDRIDGSLRVGFGKHQGMRLEELPRSWAKWAAARKDAPPESTELFRRRAAGEDLKL